MDVKGANTSPFRNLPPELRNNLKRSFLFFSAFPYWIKEKSMVTLAIRTIAIKRKTTKSILPPCLQQKRQQMRNLGIMISRIFSKLRNT